MPISPLTPTTIITQPTNSFTNIITRKDNINSTTN
jgi:hypothetical protein